MNDIYHNCSNLKTAVNWDTSNVPTFLILSNPDQVKYCKDNNIEMSDFEHTEHIKINPRPIYGFLGLVKGIKDSETRTFLMPSVFVVEKEHPFLFKNYINHLNNIL